jgi:antimicrobial peptide system SdpA family protein
MAFPASEGVARYSARANTLLAAFSVLIALAWVVIMVYSVYPALPYNPVYLPGAAQTNSLVLAPQGWAFFTRNPREERLLVYGRGPDGWRPLLLGPQARLRNKLGLARKPRAQGVELAQLVEQAQNAWEPCDADFHVCLTRMSSETQVRNSGPNRTICGPVVVVAQEPIPWAWLREPEPVTMSSRILVLKVLC